MGGWGPGHPEQLPAGALFAAIHGKEREYFNRRILASRDGIKIRFTGMQLDQTDLEVWEQAIQFARAHPLGNVCEFSMHGFLKALGRNTGRNDHEWLKGVLSRLMASGVEITHGRYTYGGSLLEFFHDEEAKVYTLRLNPTILGLYKAGWTAIDREARRRLRRKPLALWLHGYLSSDAENYDTKLETLRHLSGSKTKALFHFKANLKTALDDLEAATESRMKGAITGDLVSFERQPTASQARHLAKKSQIAGSAYLYRHFDSEGNLLYVGISLSAINRLSQHRANSDWFASIKRVEIEKFPTRGEALMAERIAVISEAPLYNIRLSVANQSRLNETGP